MDFYNCCKIFLDVHCIFRDRQRALFDNCCQNTVYVLQQMLYICTRLGWRVFQLTYMLCKIKICFSIDLYMYKLQMVKGNLQIFPSGKMSFLKNFERLYSTSSQMLRDSINTIYISFNLLATYTSAYLMLMGLSGINISIIVVVVVTVIIIWKTVLSLSFYFCVISNLLVTWSG